MLPNLRLLLTATLSTFLLTAAAGLFVSLRLAQEPFTIRSDMRATADESPVNRISLNWPLPDPERAAALRDLLPANPPWAETNEQTTPAIDAPPIAPEESPVAAPANPETQLASQPEEFVEKQSAATPLIEAPQISSSPEPAPEVTGAIGAPAQSIPAAGASAKSASLPRDALPQAHKAKAEKPAAQTKRAGTQRTALRQFPLLARRAGPQINTAAPFLFFGPASEP